MNAHPVSSDPDLSRYAHVRVHADDPPAVFDAVAKFLTIYSEHIERDVEDILHRFPDAPTRTAALSYVATIGNDIADPVIRGAVKELARRKFLVRGVL